MRFILTSNGMAPTDGALIPSLVEKGVQAAGDSLILNWIHLAGMWLAHSGLPLVTEGLMVWALFCFLMAITGKGKWMERGVKSLISFAMLGVASHAL